MERAAVAATAASLNSTSPQTQALLLMIVIDGIILCITLLHLTHSVLNIALSLQMFWGQFQAREIHQLTPVQPSRTPCNFAHKPSPDPSNVHERDQDTEGISTSEVRMVMGRLGTNWHYDLNDDQQHQARKLRANEITDMFEELEPSLEEAKAAFNVFDGNDDGFIDAKELRTVLSRLWCCHSHASEANCKEMITSYDENGDGLVDFNEFLKLLGNSFEKQNVKPL